PHSSLAPTLLPSFPTRRSSDLEAPFFLYLGRHIGLPVALEGALKLKEISYIPTDAYSAGEMKHGPIALLAEGTPVVVVATNIHRSEEHTSELQSRFDLVCRLLL